MKQQALDDSHGDPVTITFRPGMAWALYVDDGPSGPCGQSMRTTCPHSVLIVWDSEEEMREAVASGAVGRGGAKQRLQWGVVGDYTAGGVFTVVDKTI